METASHDPCPACGGEVFAPLFAKNGRQFWQCANCRLQRQCPLPTAEEIVAYYEDHYSEGRLAPMMFEQEMISLRMQRRFAEVSDHLGDGRWLDVGCGDGAFVHQARSQRVDARGIELAQTAVTAAQAKGLPVTQSRIEDHHPKSPYNAITAFDVLEHVPNPSDFMENLDRLLMAGGRVAVTVPNSNSLSCQLMGRWWYFYIPDGHLHYFTPRSLRLLFESYGYDVDSISTVFKPITLDYTVEQLQELNPVLSTIGSAVKLICPWRLATKSIPLPLGEILILATKPSLGLLFCLDRAWKLFSEPLM